MHPTLRSAPKRKAVEVSGAPILLGRRKLLVLGVAATVSPACGTANSGVGGPYSMDPGGVDPDAGDGGATSSGGSSGGSTSSGGNGSGSGGRSSGASSSNGGSGSGGGSTSSGASGSGSGGSGSGNGGPDAAACSSCSASGNILTLGFSQYPALMNVGGSAILIANGYSDPICGRSEIIVIQESAGKYVALSTACTHACCAVSFVSVGSGFRCPCHGATFDITGKPTNRITSTPLPSLPVCSDPCGVHVTIA
jgi:Rieske Fe-S protein